MPRLRKADAPGHDGEWLLQDLPPGPQEGARTLLQQWRHLQLTAHPPANRVQPISPRLSPFYNTHYQNATALVSTDTARPAIFLLSCQLRISPANHAPISCCWPVETKHDPWPRVALSTTSSIHARTNSPQPPRLDRSIIRLPSVCRPSH